MKKTLIVIMILVVALSAALAMTACKDKEQETLTIATNCEFEPFEYLDENGNKVGIDLEIAAAIADKLGMKIEIKDMAFESVVASVASGTADVAMAGLTITDERKESVDFTQYYFQSNQVVIAKNGDAILSLTTAEDIEAALEGKKIGVQNGTTGYFYVSGDSDLFGGIDAEAEGYASGALAVTALQNNQVDYVIIDAVPASKLVEANSGVSASSVVLTNEEYAFAVKKGNTELLKKINDAMTALIADGTIEAIFNKYGFTSGLNG